MKKHRHCTTNCQLPTANCQLPTANCRLLPAFCLLLSVCCLLSAILIPETVFAQETEPEDSTESLRLPEVVITGIDRSKVQRMIPKVELISDVPIITESARDRSDMMVREGDLARNNQVRQAEMQYVKAIELDPTNSRAYLRLGEVHCALNKYAEAATAYQKALDIHPNLPEAHYQLGVLYESHLQDLQKAIEHFQAYLQLGGSDRRVKIWLRNAERQQMG